jgi:type IV secretory pathway VirB9-like protein
LSKGYFHEYIYGRFYDIQVYFQSDGSEKLFQFPSNEQNYEGFDEEQDNKEALGCHIC